MKTEGPVVEVLVNTVGTWPVPEPLLAEGCRAVLGSEGIQEGELSLTLLDDTDISGLNRKYFGRERPTDVIAFALHAQGEPVLGDVYIGFEQARRQASDLGVPLDEELLRMAIHGTLHVLGYEHPEGEERYTCEMFLKQEGILRGVLDSGPLEE